MVIITFPNGTDWYKANWVFRQLAEDVIGTFPGNAELQSLMAQAEALGGLSLNSMDDAVASRVMGAIKTVADGTIRGEILGWKGKRSGDSEGQRMYIEALSELVAMINQHGGAQ